MEADAVETVEGWGKSWGLVEDKKADLAQERMQPIEKYRPGEAPKPAPESHVPEPEEFKAETEMSELNVGEQGIVDGLNETLYELDEMDGKMGTEFYSIRTEEGLENTLELLKNAKWDSGMEMVEVDTSRNTPGTEAGAFGISKRAVGQRVR